MTATKTARSIDIARHVAMLEHEIASVTDRLTSTQLELQTTYERLAECRAHDRNTQCYVEMLNQDIAILNAKIKTLARAPTQTQQDLDAALDQINSLSRKKTDTDINKWVGVTIVAIAILMGVLMQLGGAA